MRIYLSIRRNQRPFLATHADGVTITTATDVVIREDAVRQGKASPTAHPGGHISTP